MDHIRRRRGPRVGGEPQLRAGRQQAADAAQRRAPLAAAQRARHVRGNDASLALITTTFLYTFRVHKDLLGELLLIPYV